MIRLEVRQEPYCTLNTVQARKAFCYQYKDRLYQLALDETHNPKQACNLVVAAFQQAFHKYSTRACPEDCFPFLSASIYLLLATEGADCEPYPDPTDLRSRPDLSCGMNTAPSDAGSRRVNPGACAAGQTPDRTNPNRQSASGPAADTPRYARASRVDSSQPLSQQVFDPEHTEYWTPGMEQAKPAATSVKPRPAAVSSAQARPEETFAPVRPAAKPADSGKASTPPEPDFLQQPNVSQAYIYNAEIAKKRKSPVLSLLNILLTLLFLWMLVGLLARMDILPEWNLGYAWFNLNIFPLF